MGSIQKRRHGVRVQVGRVGSNEESEMPVYWFIILSKHELRGLIMTQGRFERQRERLTTVCAAASKNQPGHL